MPTVIFQDRDTPGAVPPLQRYGTESRHSRRAAPTTRHPHPPRAGLDPAIQPAADTGARDPQGPQPLSTGALRRLLPAPAPANAGLPESRALPAFAAMILLALAGAAGAGVAFLL